LAIYSDAGVFYLALCVVPFSKRCHKKMFKQAADRNYGEMAALNCAHRRYVQKKKENKKHLVYVRTLQVIFL